MQRIVEIPENFSTLLEKLHYEYFTMKDNVTFLIDQHKNDIEFIDSPLFEKYHDREIAKKIEYENIKQELENKYIPKDLEDKKYSWKMDFQNKQLIIEVI